MKNKKIRHQFLLEPDLTEKLESLCRLPGATKTDVVAKALRAFIDRRGETEIDQRYAKRLDSISSSMVHIRSDVEMILESLALFIRFNIAMNAAKPMPDKAAYASAHERYLRFVDLVGRHIAQGKKPFDADEKEAL